MKEGWFNRYSIFFKKVVELIPDDATVLIIGANDGITADPSHQIWRDSWKGIFVEPNSQAMAALRKNRKGRFIRAAIADETPLKLWTMTAKAAKAYEEKTGANGFCLTSATKDYVLSRITKHITGMEGELREISVPAMTIEQVMDEAAIDGAELVQIDCEGMDGIVLHQILRAFKSDPRVIMFEHKSLSEESTALALLELKSAGYEWAVLKTDTVAWK